MLRILNIVVDDIFIDGIIKSFDLTSNRCNHDYIILRNNESNNYKDIKQNDRVRVVKPQNFYSYINERKYHAIIIHSLREITLKLLPLIDNKIIVVWKAWGFDLYTTPHIYTPFIKINLYKPLTKNANKKSLFLRLRELHGYLHYLLNRKGIFKAISRIDFFSGVLHCEYDLMCRLKFFNAERVFIPYISINNNEDYNNINSQDKTCSKRNILIGNSNNPTNNHLEAFEILKQANVNNRIIFCPLSYGGTSEYRRKVIETGKEYWGDNFVPLLKLLPQQEYENIIESCSIAVFNHERQQAMGNISHAFNNNCTVYLSPTSINYKELRKLGFVVRDITKDLSSLSTLSDSELRMNKVLNSKLESKQTFLEAVYDMYDKIEYKLQQRD